MGVSIAEKSNQYAAGAVACALAFSILFSYRLDICHRAFPLTFALVGLPVTGTVLSVLSFFEPKSGPWAILSKLAIIGVNLSQLAMGLLSLTGLSLAQCG